MWPLFCCAVLTVVYSFAIILLGREGWLLYFNCILMSCDVWCSVSLPHGAVVFQFSLNFCIVIKYIQQR